MYVTSINQSHFFCIPVLLLFYKLLLLLICYDILAIENYLQCRTDDGGGGSRNHLQAWLFLPLNMLKRFLFFKGKGVSFSISKKGCIVTCASSTPAKTTLDEMYGRTSSDKSNH